MAYIGQESEYIEFQKQTLTANGSTTIFTLDQAAGNANGLLVSVGGVVQEPDVAYTVSAFTITFAVAPTNGYTIYIVYLGKELTITQPADNSIAANAIVNSAVTDVKINSMAASKLSGSLSGVDGSALTGVVTDTSVIEDNIAVLGFKMASNNSLTRYNMVDQVIDEYQDDSGLLTETNVDRDSSGNYISTNPVGNATGTLISTSNTALSAPTTGDLVVLVDDAYTASTINTDIKGYVSRNGGTGWDQVTLVDQGTWGSTNKKILSGHDVTFSNSASGTDMKYKLEWANQSYTAAVTGVGAYQDSSSNAHTVTAVGTVTTTTAYTKVGTHGIDFNTATNGYLTIPAHADFQYGTGDFEMSAWVYQKSRVAGENPIFANRIAGGTYTEDWLVYTRGSSNNLCVNDSGTQWMTANTTFPLNTWIHIMVSRVGNTHYLFQDGVQVATTTQAHNFNEINGVNIGYDTLSAPAHGNANMFHGYMDEILFRKGVGTSSGFTPSTSAHTVDSNTKLLIHGEAIASTPESGKETRIHATSLAWA